MTSWVTYLTVVGGAVLAGIVAMNAPAGTDTFVGEDIAELRPLDTASMDRAEHLLAQLDQHDEASREATRQRRPEAIPDRGDQPRRPLEPGSHAQRHAGTSRRALPRKTTQRSNRRPAVTATSPLQERLRPLALRAGPRQPVPRGAPHPPAPAVEVQEPRSAPGSSTCTSRGTRASSSAPAGTARAEASTP